MGGWREGQRENHISKGSCDWGLSQTPVGNPAKLSGALCAGQPLGKARKLSLRGVKIPELSHQRRKQVLQYRTPPALKIS